MKYAVLGSAGQLGRDLCPRLPGEVIALTRAHADLAHPEKLKAALRALRPDVVVNCAAFNWVDRAESEQEAAFAVNAWGAQAVADVCRDLQCTLVHFSTDYVFGLEERRQTPYGETEAPGPVNTYGLSKLAGEYRVRSLAPRHFVIRTCGLYGVWGSGGKGGNFVETMLRVASQGKPLRVVADQFCTPSFTVHVAEATAALLTTEAYGLYHVTNAGACSWHEFAQAIFEQAGVAADLTPIGSADWKSAARRPTYSALAQEKYRALGLPPLPPWQDGLRAYLDRRRMGADSQSASS